VLLQGCTASAAAQPCFSKPPAPKLAGGLHLRPQAICCCLMALNSIGLQLLALNQRTRQLAKHTTRLTEMLCNDFMHLIKLAQQCIAVQSSRNNRTAVQRCGKR
jgi:hypothetical protein